MPFIIQVLGAAKQLNLFPYSLSKGGLKEEMIFPLWRVLNHNTHIKSHLILQPANLSFVESLSLIANHVNML